MSVRRTLSPIAGALAGAAVAFVAMGTFSAPQAAEGRNRAVTSPDSPAAIGPYSQGILVPPGRTLYLSGQLPLDPATGQMVQGDITVLTHRAMQNLGAVLGEAGGDFDDVVKCTIYVLDLNDFAAINAAYGSYFGTRAPPARATVQVARLPRDGRVEIECVAVLP
jgi:2-iminobutanoate/2-iminopropanoate deaminase